jgi:hypothetical protein
MLLHPSIEKDILEVVGHGNPVPLRYNAGSVERLVALTDEHADFSREFSSSFPLRGLVHVRA